MKKTITLALMAFAFAANVSAQQIEKIFDKYDEDERFQYIYKKGSGSALDKLENLDGVFENREETGKMIDKKMLILSTNVGNLQTKFTHEVDDALKHDKYENVSYVRNGKNRVSEYYRKTSGGVDKVQFIDNGTQNVLLIWRSYERKK